MDVLRFGIWTCSELVYAWTCSDFVSSRAISRWQGSISVTAFRLAYCPISRLNAGLGKHSSLVELSQYHESWVCCWVELIWTSSLVLKILVELSWATQLTCSTRLNKDLVKKVNPAKCQKSAPSSSDFRACRAVFLSGLICPMAISKKLSGRRSFHFPFGPKF